MRIRRLRMPFQTLLVSQRKKNQRRRKKTQENMILSLRKYWISFQAFCVEKWECKRKGKNGRKKNSFTSTRLLRTLKTRFFSINGFSVAFTLPTCFMHTIWSFYIICYSQWNIFEYLTINSGNLVLGIWYLVGTDNNHNEHDIQAL